MTETTPSHPTTASAVTYWQAMRFRDVDAMTAFLRAVGFTEHALYRDDQDPSIVIHAEYLWSGGGGLMFGSAREDQLEEVGRGSAYLVTPDPDDFARRAVAAGGTLVAPVTEKEYGGRGGAVHDPEGNGWSFGDYQPA